MKNEVSLCMIVKNEEEDLPRCLSSIRDIIDEIIIIDTGSTDKTVEIAKSFGAKVYYFKWNDNFSEARNESIKYATKDWILILDADDELYPEDKKKLKILLETELNHKVIYNFETLSYYGSSIREENISVNVNPRLFKNNRNIHYVGEIHNQLICTQGEYNVICDTVKIHHYGYLDKKIISQNKRKRNISILKRQIKKNPNNEFAYFNLGNEYAALGDFKNALKYYYKVYKKFDPNKGYSFVLILRIIISNYNLEAYDEALKFINIGTKYYHKSTDLYFCEALIYNKTKRPTLQIRALEKCIKLGEAPANFKFLLGTGGFKAYYELGNVYLKYKDYEVAYSYYTEAMNINPSYIEPLYKSADMLRKQKISLNEFDKIIEKFIPKDEKSYESIVGELFYVAGYYSKALEYVKKSDANGMITENMTMLKARCLLRIGKFKEELDITGIDEKNTNYVIFSMYKVLSALLLKKHKYALSILQSINSSVLSIYDRKVFSIYYELSKLFTEKTAKIISEDENAEEYLKIILEILEILLENHKYDEFNTAINLLNLINNKYALLNIGKLYYRFGHVDIAKKEILRSIKEFEVYDSESLEILMN